MNDSKETCLLRTIQNTCCTRTVEERAQQVFFIMLSKDIGEVQDAYITRLFPHIPTGESTHQFDAPAGNRGTKPPQSESFGRPG